MLALWQLIKPRCDSARRRSW